MTAAFAPGDLVYARGREWVALPSPGRGDAVPPATIRQRGRCAVPASCARTRAGAARSFRTAGSGSRLATQDGARLLSEALRLSLRRGAGPFRSAARVAFEPRAYQLVPLLMALRLPSCAAADRRRCRHRQDHRGRADPARADRSRRGRPLRGPLPAASGRAMDRRIERPSSTSTRSRLPPASAPRLERGLPPSQTLFDAHPYTVVSLDYIKAEQASRHALREPARRSSWSTRRMPASARIKAVSSASSCSSDWPEDQSAH